jgi:hypothetical protein
MSTSSADRHRLEDEAQALKIRRDTRHWPACCRSWIVGRVIGDLTGPIVRDPDDGRPLCPHCRRRTASRDVNRHVYTDAETRRTLAA